MVWNKQAECMSKEEKEKLQLERLQQTVKLAYNNVSFYKEKFDELCEISGKKIKIFQFES